MIVTVKNTAEIERMKKAGQIVRDVLLLAEEKIHAGMTTKFLDSIIRDFIERHGATPSFLNYRGYPASACISLDDEVVHGIPSEKRFIEEGQIVSVDVGLPQRLPRRRRPYFLHRTGEPGEKRTRQSHGRMLLQSLRRTPRRSASGRYRSSSVRTRRPPRVWRGKRNGGARNRQEHA